MGFGVQHGHYFHLFVKETKLFNATVIVCALYDRDVPRDVGLVVGFRHVTAGAFVPLGLNTVLKNELNLPEVDVVAYLKPDFRQSDRLNLVVQAAWELKVCGLLIASVTTSADSTKWVYYPELV